MYYVLLFIMSSSLNKNKSFSYQLSLRVVDNKYQSISNNNNNLLSKKHMFTFDE